MALFIMSSCITLMMRARSIMCVVPHNMDGLKGDWKKEYPKQQKSDIFFWPDQ